MNKRTTLAVSLAAALTFSGALYGVASATEAPPKPPTCGQAITDVLNFKDVTAAQAKLDELNGTLKSLNETTPPTLAALKQAVADDVAADNLAGLKADSQKTLDAKAALKARTDLIADVQNQIVVANKAMVDAKAKLAVLVKVRDQVCAPIPPKDDKDCADFPNQAAAQAVLDADKSDPNRLDANHNGIACEAPAVEGPPAPPATQPPPVLVPVPVPGDPAPVVTNPQITVVPNTTSGVNTGDGSLA